MTSLSHEHYIESSTFWLWKKRCKTCYRKYGYEISFWNGLKKLERVSHEGSKNRKEIYYDPKQGFSGVDYLISKTGYSEKTVEEW